MARPSPAGPSSWLARAESIAIRLVRALPRGRLGLLALVTGAYIVTQYNAVTLVASIYGYFEPRPLDLADHGLALVCLLAPVLLLPRGSSPATAASWIFYFFIYFSAAVAGISLFATGFDYLSFIGMIAFGGLVFHLAARVKIPAFSGAIRARHLDVALVCATVALVVYAWRLSGFSLRFELGDVYERRLDVREGGGIAGYLVAPLRLVLPVLAAYAWQVRRNVTWPAIVMFGCIALFSFDGTKTVLFMPFFLWMILLGLRQVRLPALILTCIILLNGAALAEYRWLDSTQLAEYGVRRAFVVPGMLASVYWSYAPDAQSLRTISFEVGEFLFGDARMNANTNFLMWGWVWARWHGVAAVALGAGLLVATFRSFPGPKFPYLGALMGAGCMFFWSEQFIHTALLSSGVALVVGVALLLRTIPGGFPGLVPKRD